MAEIKIKTAGGGQLNEPNKIDPRFHGGRLKELFTSILFYLSILTFIIGFQFSDTMLNGWTQQFMPNLNGKQITDVTFLDSLNGYAVATQTMDSSYILKTTNGGDNWQIIHRQLFAMTHLQFFNVNTGYAGGGYLYKTINGGFTWTQINTPASTVEKMFVLNDSTIWFVNSESLTGGVYRTTNGGGSWDRQLDLGSQNPNHIYMYNERIGFICETNNYIRKTTNGGLNWDTVVNVESFTDMFFIDSLTGWRAYGTNVYKTTDGGDNWITQRLPYGGNLVITTAYDISVLNKDTIWAVGGVLQVGSGTRGVLFRTTNGGNNWLFQLPDTAINNFIYYHIQFINNRIGWAYFLNRGIHTTTGGDTGWVMGITQISSEIPKQFKLYQNYPNPFNPKTIINYELRITSYVILAVYDITGKHIIDLANQKQDAGKYEVDFLGDGYSSGVYFYKIIIETEKGGKVYKETKKMLMIK